MLVCNVSVRPQNVTLAADLVEAGLALAVADYVTLFGPLVDSPGNATDTVNAVVGQFLVETASATDTLTVAMAYRITVLEDTTARESNNALFIPKHVVTGTVTEAATAAATQDATSGAGLVPRSGMVGTVYINSDGTARQADADGTMVNL